jgi:hypothetical protein
MQVWARHTQGSAGGLLRVAGKVFSRIPMGKPGCRPGPDHPVLSTQEKGQKHTCLSFPLSTTVAQELHEILGFLKRSVTETVTKPDICQSGKLLEAIRAEYRGQPQHACSSSIFIYKQQFPLTLYHKKSHLQARNKNSEQN